MKRLLSDPTVVLRFRDLVTEPGGTIDSHIALIRSFGETWWGWMKRTDEIANRAFFATVMNRLDANGFAIVYLFDTDSRAFYDAELTGIAVAPDRLRIGSPEPEKTPEYYNYGRYPAWFRFRKITDSHFPKGARFAAFPSACDASTFQHLKNIKLRDPDDLKKAELTLWVIQSLRPKKAGRAAGAAGVRKPPSSI